MSSKLELAQESRKAFSMQEVADLTGSSLSFVKKAVARGDIPSRKIGGCRFVSADALEQILSGPVSA